jgi:hypothetical protein
VLTNSSPKEQLCVRYWLNWNNCVCMTGAWEKLCKQGASTNLEGARWRIEHLLQAEHTGWAYKFHQTPDACCPVPAVLRPGRL